MTNIHNGPPLEIVEAPRLLAGRMLFRAPTLDEGGDYEGGERWAAGSLAEAHIASSFVGDGRHAPLLDIDIPVKIRTADDEWTKLLGLGASVTFTVDMDVREREVLVASRLMEAMDLGTLSGGSILKPTTVTWFMAPGLDFEFVPSSTQGHGHLYVDKSLPADPYFRLLVALARVGILEPGFVRAAIGRGYSAGRLPWVKKGTLILHSEHVEKKPPVTLAELDDWIEEGFGHLDPVVR